ncbi:MAG: N-acyl homoserine lactonase family protein [Pseudomonadota bacterium]
MSLSVKALHIGDIMSDWSFSLFNFNPGRKTWGAINSFLIMGAEKPILVDSGIQLKNRELLMPFGMLLDILPEQDLMKQLKENGLKPEDIGYVIHTHLDIDHTGYSNLFPNAKMVIQRKEIAFHAAAYMPGHCPDLPWFVSNMNRIEFIDGDIELFPGIKCVLTPAHTAGHQHIEVQTDIGKAILCGDTVYDIPMQLEDKVPGFMWPPGNCYNQGQMQVELHKLKIELKRGSMILPAHTYEPFDRYRLGEKIGDKRVNYQGFASLDWPPK